MYKHNIEGDSVRGQRRRFVWRLGIFNSFFFFFSYCQDREGWRIFFTCGYSV